MIVQSSYRISRSEFDSLSHHRSEKFIEEKVKRQIADDLSEKLIPFIQIEKEKRHDETLFNAKMVMIGSEDFITIRGLLNRLKRDPNLLRTNFDALEQIEHTLYAEFNSFPAELVLPLSEC